MKLGKMRTFGGLRKRHRQFIESGGNLKDAQKFANCIHEPILDEADETLVIYVIPPPELHLLIGAVDVHILIRIYGLKFVERLGRSVGASRHGYQGKKAYEMKMRRTHKTSGLEAAGIEMTYAAGIEITYVNFATNGCNDNRGRI